MTQLPITFAERQPLWVAASYRLSGWAGAASKAMPDRPRGDELVDSTIGIQDLGRAEGLLLDIEGRMSRLIGQKQNDAPDIMGVLLTQALGASRLWVFGLYESLRTYRNAVRYGDARAWTPFKALSDDLNIVREPLAKQQVAGRATAHVAERLIDPTTGRVGWQVFDPRTNTSRRILRIELADQFLSAAAGLLGAGEVEARQREGKAADK